VSTRVVLVLAAFAIGCGARTALTDVETQDSGVLVDSAIAIDSGIPKDPPRDSTPPGEDVPPVPRVLEWERMALASKERPSSRMNHFAVHDPSTDSLFVFGGYDPYDRSGAEQARRDVWQLTIATHAWTRVGKLARPMVRLRGAAMLDAPRHRIIVVANTNLDRPTGSETIALDMTTWKETPLPAGPWPRGFSVMAGGATASPSGLVMAFANYDRIVDATWFFDATAGAWATVSGPGPKPRAHTELATDGLGGDPILYSGYYGDPLYDLWRFDLGARRWTEIRTEKKLPARATHASVVDAARDRLIVFGGSVGASIVMEGLLLLDLKTGEAATPDFSFGPEHRRDHTFTLDPATRRVYLFGGAYSSERCFDDTWALTLD